MKCIREFLDLANIGFTSIYLIVAADMIYGPCPSEYNNRSQTIFILQSDKGFDNNKYNEASVVIKFWLNLMKLLYFLLFSKKLFTVLEN